MDSIVIFFAQYVIFIVGLVAFGYWLTLPKKQKIQVIIFGLVIAITAYVLSKLGNSIVHSPRPYTLDQFVPLFAYPKDNGFPSDHTLISACIAATIFFVSKKWGIGLFVVALTIGSARVLAHIHHPIDIMGGFVFAIIAGLIAYGVTNQVSKLLAQSKYAEQLGFETTPSN